MTDQPVDDTELNWIEANWAALLKQYSGEWIAVKINRVVAHAPRLIDIRHQCEAQGIEDMFTMKIESLPDLWMFTESENA